MARPVIKFDQKNCAECGLLLPPVTFKRPYAKLCRECKFDRRSGNHELRKIFRDLKKKPQEVEDWGSENIKTNDDEFFRKPKW